MVSKYKIPFSRDELYLGVIKIRFKLHLRSKFGEFKTDQIPPLPLNKTVVDVFSDFLQYLLQCSSTYIQDTHANGGDLWASVKDDIHFVLSHPNGWEGKEQAQMRYAAVRAGLIPDTPGGHSRISFVTEGEASLHFAINNGVLSGALMVIPYLVSDMGRLTR